MDADITYGDREDSDGVSLTAPHRNIAIDTDGLLTVVTIDEDGTVSRGVYEPSAMSWPALTAALIPDELAQVEAAWTPQVMAAWQGRQEDMPHEEATPVPPEPSLAEQLASLQQQITAVQAQLTQGG